MCPRLEIFRELSGDRSEDKENRRGLAACSEGYWIVTPTGGGYPFFAVGTDSRLIFNS